MKIMKQTLRVTDVTRCASVTIKPRSTYICLLCRHIAFASAPRARARPTPPVSYIQRRFASDDWTERLRQRIWGTTNPPGQKDPYVHETPREEDEELDTTDLPPETPSRKWSKKKSDTKDYVPATSWDGLDQIGGKDQWWEEAWDQRHPYEGFMGPTKLESREEISEVIHRALVEIYTLKEAHIPMEIFMSYAETPEAHYFKDVSFKQDADGNTIPVFASEELREQVLDSLTEVENALEAYLDAAEESEASDPEETESVTNNSTIQADEAPDREETELITNNSTLPADEAADSKEAELITENSTVLADEAADPKEAELITENSTVQAEEAPEMLQEKSLENQESIEREEPVLDNLHNDETWLNVSFRDPYTKFAIIKRVMQLTGVRIPDPSIDSIDSAKALLGFLVKKPKPKKLAEFLMADENLNSLPNVKIMDRRYTPIDKEKQVGRWKVIEKELTRQGLPVTGGRENVWNAAKT